jgi:hypothetical protein
VVEITALIVGVAAYLLYIVADQSKDKTKTVKLPFEKVS